MFPDSMQGLINERDNEEQTNAKLIGVLTGSCKEAKTPIQRNLLSEKIELCHSRGSITDNQRDDLLRLFSEECIDNGKI